MIFPGTNIETNIMKAKERDSTNLYPLYLAGICLGLSNVSHYEYLNVVKFT